MDKSSAVSTQIAELTYSPQRIAGAVALWADAKTRPESLRRADLVRDKQRALVGEYADKVDGFFTFTQKHPARVTPIDVKTWQAELEKTLAPATVYAMVSRVSSFYTWAMKDETLARVIRSNPTNLARPKAPKKYQNEKVKAWSDAEVKTLLQTVKAKADGGSIVGKRDYAMLTFYLATGLRRNEIARLRWGDIDTSGTLTVRVLQKGGNYHNREVEAAVVKLALLDYLAAAGRLDGMTDETPLWTSHDRANVKPGKALTSHAFAKRLKRYAKQAGLGDVHLHQTRHTYARIVGEETGSMRVVQDMLNHKDPSATKVYLETIMTQKDEVGELVAGRLGL